MIDVMRHTLISLTSIALIATASSDMSLGEPHASAQEELGATLSLTGALNHTSDAARRLNTVALQDEPDAATTMHSDQTIQVIPPKFAALEAAYKDQHREWVIFAAYPPFAPGMGSPSGHIFVILAREDPVNQLSTIQAYGFFPADLTYPLGEMVRMVWPGVPGSVDDNFADEHEGALKAATVVFRVEISQIQWLRIAGSLSTRYGLVKAWPAGNWDHHKSYPIDVTVQYQVGVNDCVTFADTVARAIGLVSPLGPHTWRLGRDLFPDNYLSDLIALNSYPDPNTATSAVYVKNEVWFSNFAPVAYYTGFEADGPGSIQFQNGVSLEGYFKHGLPNGLGTQHNPDGSTLSGTWVDGTFQSGTFTNASGATITLAPDQVLGPNGRSQMPSDPNVPTAERAPLQMQRVGDSPGAGAGEAHAGAGGSGAAHEPEGHMQIQVDHGPVIDKAIEKDCC